MEETFLNTVGLLLVPIFIVLVVVGIYYAIKNGKIKAYPNINFKRIIKTSVIMVILIAIGFIVYSVYTARLNQAVIASKWDMPRCSNGYDFSKVKPRTRPFNMEYGVNCVEAVKLPVGTNFDLDPSGEVMIKFINKVEFEDGPGAHYQNWAGIGSGRESFKIYGIKKPGNLKIFLKKR